MRTKQNELAKQKNQLEHIRSEQQEYNNNKTRIEQIQTDVHTSIQAIKDDLATHVKECVAGADVVTKYIVKTRSLEDISTVIELAETALAIGDKLTNFLWRVSLGVMRNNAT